MSDEKPPTASATPVDVAPLRADRVFHGLVSTQFLGAFNDNYFKQMVLLKCTELASTSNLDLQPLALAAFALPFVLLSGLGGFVSDRYSKRSIIVWCKVAEIAVMAAALWVLLIPDATPERRLRLLIAVLAFMGAQSAIFGPSKYGILPELFGRRQLLPVNGAIQMTTFLAIILGMAGAGIALDSLDNSLWLCSLLAVTIAAIGTLTALAVRHTPVARPNLPFQRGNLFIPADVRDFLRSQPKVFQAVIVMMTFWFIGGVAQPAVNNIGEHVLHISKTRTSLIAASMGIGIALGCVIAGLSNRGEKSDGGRWVRRGSWMIVGALLLIAGLSAMSWKFPIQPSGAFDGIARSLISATPVEWMFRLSMLLLGVSAGVFVVPIQVFIQDAPPVDKKGRMIGAMNVMTWLGILLSAAFLGMMSLVMNRVSPNSNGQELQFLVFLALAAVMLPIAMFYRLPDA